MDIKNIPTKWKCDCCGKLTLREKLSLVSIPEKEFEGVACTKCEQELKEKPLDSKEI